MQTAASDTSYLGGEGDLIAGEVLMPVTRKNRQGGLLSDPCRYVLDSIRVGSPLGAILRALQ